LQSSGGVTPLLASHNRHLAFQKNNARASLAGFIPGGKIAEYPPSDESVQPPIGSALKNNAANLTVV